VSNDVANAQVNRMMVPILCRPVWGRR